MEQFVVSCLYVGRDMFSSESFATFREARDNIWELEQDDLDYEITLTHEVNGVSTEL
jgi:hypothetical protein